MTTDQLLAELERLLAARRERKMGDYKMVPVEPTVEMLAAGKYALEAGCYASGIYADMLAAAPAVQGEPVAAGGEHG